MLGREIRKIEPKNRPAIQPKMIEYSPRRVSIAPPRIIQTPTATKRRQNNAVLSIFVTEL